MAIESLNDVLKKGLVDMKLPKKENKREEEMEVMKKEYEEDKYPYGLRIDLNTESMKALGLNAEEFTVSQEIKVLACCDITNTRSENRQKGGEEVKNQSVNMQITSMKIVKKEG